jgi:hypothetical protein
MSVLKTAEKTEQKIHEILGEAFNLPKAVIYSVKTKPSNELEVVKRHDCGDVYDLLSDDYTLNITKNSEYIAVLTCGWASPIDPEQGESDDDIVAPSQHPQRRRVRLMVLASRNGVASVLRFSDSPNETVTDDGNARGSLADAVLKLFAQAEAGNN